MTTPADTKRADAKRVAVACLIGTAIEWYDFFIYGTASALIFPKLFFPSVDPTAATLLSFSTFALAFMVRPIGGLIFGHFGDRIGRKALLVTTVLLMGTATTLIGLLPTYAAIGVAAPLLLVVLRVLQGISVGGEYGGAVLMAVEHAEPGKRGYYGSWVQMGSPAGLILANAAFLSVTQLPEDALLSWGWRIPFLLGSILLVVGVVIRLRITESPRFEEVRQQGDIAKVPALVVLRDYPGRVLLTAGAYVGTGVVFYGSSIFGLSYGIDKLGFTRPQVLTIVLIGQVLALFAMPMFATLSDRIGRKTVFIGSLVGMGVLVFPWLWLYGTGSFAWALLGFLLLYLPYAANYGTMAAFFAEVYETRIGYSGLSLGYQLGTVFGSGFAPMIALWLLRETGTVTAVGFYMIGAVIISMLCAYLLTSATSVAFRSPHYSFRESEMRTSELKPH
jgi:MFS family permease